MKDELVDIVMNIHQFNQDLTSLNIKYAETIEEQKQEIERLINIINLCKDEMYMTTYKDMNNIEKWESKMNAFVDILDKVKDIIGGDK